MPWFDFTTHITLSGTKACSPGGAEVATRAAPDRMHVSVRVSMSTGTQWPTLAKDGQWVLYRAHLMALVCVYVHGPDMAPRASLHMILTRFSEGKSHTKFHSGPGRPVFPGGHPSKY